MPRERPDRLGVLRVTGWAPSVERHWWGYVGVVGASLHGLGVWRVLGSIGGSGRPALLDSIIFEYIGWYLTVGGALYVDVYDVKPPLAYEVPAVLTLLGGGDPWVSHWLAVGATAAAGVATGVAAGGVVRAATGDAHGAAAAGLAVYVFPAFHWRAAFGFKPKYFVACCGLLAVYLALRERPLSAGAAAAAATGFWQFGVVFPVVVVGRWAHDRAWRGVLRAVAGMVAVAAATLAPVIAWGALDAMLVETVIAPLASAGGQPLRLETLEAQVVGAPLPIAVLGVVGLALAVRSSGPGAWWLPALGGWFGLQALVLDLDGAPDAFLLWVVLAVGAGMAIHGLPREGRLRRWSPAVIAGLAVVASVSLGGFGAAQLPVPDPVVLPEGTPTAPYSVDEQAALFWHRLRPGTCRVFYGPSHARWVRLIDGDPLAERCGRLGPAIRALRARLGL